MAIFYIDLVSGNDSNDGSSWANAWKTITNGATAARIAPGDTIRISKTADPIPIGNATWTDLSKTVTLAAARTLTVDRCETAWTAANSATVTRQGVATDAKEGSYCMQVAAPASPATNTKYAYFAISSTDFSSKQELTFWIKNEVAVAAGNWKICLCSDNAGATPVDTFEIIAIPSTGRWLPLTITRTGGGNLGNAIQSIALYSSSVAPTASKYVRLDNFEAAATNDLNLQTLISKNGAAQGGTEGYYGIQSIVGTTVLLDNDTNTKANAGRGYAGTTETVATYIRKTFKTPLTSDTYGAINTINDSGTLGNLIFFEFGYEVGSTNQNGETFLDGLNGNGYGIYIYSKYYIYINYLNTVRFYSGLILTASSFITLLNISGSNNNQVVVTLSSSNNNNISCINATNNGAYSINVSLSSCNIISIVNGNSNYNGLSIYGEKNKVIISNVINNSNYAISFSGTGSNNIITVNNSSSGTGINMDGGINYFINSIFNQSTEYYANSLYNDSWIWSLNHDNTTGNHWGFTSQATVNWQTSIKHDTDPGAWKTAITGSTRNTNYPVKLKIAEIAGTASTAMTIKAWVKKDHATNVACKLVCYADAGAGIATNESDTKANDTDWEQLSITVTPTGTNPVVQVYLESWYVAGTSNTYVGSIEIS